MPPSSATAYQALSAYKAPDPTSVLTQANQQSGVTADQQRVSDLRGAVNNLTTSLNAVDPSVTGRTTGTFTTEAQRGALVNKESQPIQQDITARSQDLNAANADLNTAQGSANTLASAILGQSKDSYQKLLDQYNGALASEKAQSDQQQFAQTQALEKAKLDEQAREANLTAGNNSALADELKALQDQNKSTTPTDPVHQAAYNDVYTRINSLTLPQIISDYNATKVSAGYGNPKDQAKIQLYETLMPQWYGPNWLNSGGGSGASIVRPSPSVATSTPNRTFFPQFTVPGAR